MFSSDTSKSCWRPLISNRSAFSFASHSLDSKSLFLYSSRACSRSGSLLPLMIVGCKVVVDRCYEFPDVGCGLRATYVNSRVCFGEGEAGNGRVGYTNSELPGANEM